VDANLRQRVGGRGGKRGAQKCGKRSSATTEMLSNSGVGKRLLTVVEAAEYLGLSIYTVYKKARLRELPSVKVGRALRFDVEELDLYIKQHAIKTIE